MIRIDRKSKLYYPYIANKCSGVGASTTVEGSGLSLTPSTLVSRVIIQPVVSACCSVKLGDGALPVPLIVSFAKVIKFYYLDLDRYIVDLQIYFPNVILVKVHCYKCCDS